VCVCPNKLIKLMHAFYSSTLYSLTRLIYFSSKIRLQNFSPRGRGGGGGGGGGVCVMCPNRFEVDSVHVIGYSRRYHNTNEQHLSARVINSWHSCSVVSGTQGQH